MNSLRHSIPLIAGIATLACVVARAEADKSSASAPSSDQAQTNSQPAATAEQPSKASNSSAASNAADARTTSHTASTPESQGSVYVASDDARDRTADKLAGREIIGSDGRELGTLTDFLLDAQSGDVVFGIVSSGGIAGIGEKQRLVPYKAFRPGKMDAQLTVGMTQPEWDQLPPVERDTLNQGRFTMSDGERRQLAERFGRAAWGEKATGSEFYTAGISTQLIRASDLRDEAVYAGGRDVGKILAVTIDPDAAKASALFEPRRELTDADRPFIVPLDRFSFGGADERIGTLLSRRDFAPKPAATPAPAAQALAQNTPPSPAHQANQKSNQKSDDAAQTPVQPTDEQLTPTGKTSADQLPEGADPALAGTAQAVRQALDADPALARADVRVMPQQGKIVLEGQVKDDAQKTAIERAAENAAQGKPIHSQLEIAK